MLLGNYPADLNETYTCYKGGYVELIYQFLSNLKFSQKYGKVLKAIDLFCGLVDVTFGNFYVLTCEFNRVFIYYDIIYIMFEY